MASDDPKGVIDSLDSDLALMRRIADASAIAICAQEASAETEEATVAVRQALALADASLRLRNEMELAAARDVAAMNMLRLAVREFTFAHRDDGLAPEQVLIALKKLVNERALPAAAPPYSRKTGDYLREAISTWSIKAYFNAEGG